MSGNEERLGRNGGGGKWLLAYFSSVCLDVCLCRGRSAYARQEVKTGSSICVSSVLFWLLCGDVWVVYPLALLHTQLPGGLDLLLQLLLVLVQLQQGLLQLPRVLLLLLQLQGLHRHRILELLHTHTHTHTCTHTRARTHVHAHRRRERKTF